MPSLIMVPVDSMFSTSFWAVPAFSRVEPVMTSGPGRGQMVSSASLDIGESGLHTRAMAAAPLARAYFRAPML